MAAGDLIPGRVAEAAADLLRKQVGIDPGQVGPLIDLASIGMVNLAWRNTCIESWHVKGRLSDGDMLRVNSHTTWRVRQLLRRWLRENGMDAASPASALDDVTADGAWKLASRVFGWLVNSSRVLPTGVTLAQLAGDGLAEYKDCADAGLSVFGEQSDKGGAQSAFALAAAHGGLACPHWWGHPRWAGRVERFIQALANPADEHWGSDGEHKARLSAEPADVADRARLHRLLLSQPWELAPDAAQWLADAGIRYIRTS